MIYDWRLTLGQTAPAGEIPYGGIVSVQISREEYPTALTDDGIDELRDMLLVAWVSVRKWQSFLEDFVDGPDIIARVKDQPLR